MFPVGGYFYPPLGAERELTPHTPGVDHIVGMRTAMRMEAAAGPEPASLTAMLTALPIKLRCHTYGWYSGRHPRLFV